MLVKPIIGGKMETKVFDIIFWYKSGSMKSDIKFFDKSAPVGLNLFNVTNKMYKFGFFFFSLTINLQLENQSLSFHR